MEFATPVKRVKFAKNKANGKIEKADKKVLKIKIHIDLVLYTNFRFMHGIGWVHAMFIHPAN